MTIACRLRLLLARVNLARAQADQPPITLRQLAAETGVALSVISGLMSGRNQRIDFQTIDRLLSFFNRYFPVDAGDLLQWEAPVPTVVQAG